MFWIWIIGGKAAGTWPVAASVKVDVLTYIDFFNDTDWTMIQEEVKCLTVNIPDNSPSYSTKKTNESVNKMDFKGIRLMNWLVWSFNINPFENLSIKEEDYIGRQQFISKYKFWDVIRDVVMC